MQTSTQYTEEESALSKGFRLFQNTPNPFNPETRITFELIESTQVALSVYDLSGKKISTLHDGYARAGTHEVGFDGSGFASGMYLVELRTKDVTQQISMTLAK
jgi:TRAP-type uncharacterized transport system substrate-binding protein